MLLALAVVLPTPHDYSGTFQGGYSARFSSKGTPHSKNVLFYLKISEWLGSISVTCVLETTLADHKWTNGVKSDVSTPIQGSSSVMNDYKTQQGWIGVETSDLTSPSVHL